MIGTRVPEPVPSPDVASLSHSLPPELAAVLQSLTPEARARVAAAWADVSAAAAQAEERAAAAEARAARLGTIQEAARRVGRTLDVPDLAAELGRQVGRLLEADLVSVLLPDADGTHLVTAWRTVAGSEVPRAPLAIPSGGALASAIRGGHPVSCALDAEPSSLEELLLDDVLPDGAGRCALVVPMITGKRLEGAVVAVSRPRATFAAADVEVSSAVATTAATALRNARLYGESERERRTSEALSAVASAVGESLRLGEVQLLILRHAMALLHAGGAALAMHEDRYLRIVAGVGSSAILSGMHLPLEGSMAGQVVRDGTYRVLNDVAATAGAYRPTQRLANVRKIVMVPLVTSRGILGVLTANDRDADFTDDDARVLQRLADQVAVAIANARLFEEARAATQAWRVLFDAVPSGVVVLDEDGRIVQCNARAATTAGLPPEAALVGRWFAEAVLDAPPEGPLPAPVQRALRDGAAGRGTMTVRGRVLEVLASPHPDGGAVVSLDDVTGVQALESRFRAVVETATDAMVITGLDRRVLFANAAAQELFGRPDPLEGMPVSRLVEPAWRARVAEAHAAALAGTPQRYEAVIVRGDGEQRTVAVSSGALAGPDGPTGTVASLRDVTEERRTRDAIAAAAARYLALFDHASDAVWTLDRRGLVTSANVAAATLAGAAGADLLGRALSALVAPDDHGALASALAGALGGELQHGPLRLVGHGGATVLRQVTHIPIRDGTAVVGVLGIARPAPPPG